MTASFLAVADMAAFLPFLNAIFLKKLDRAVSFKLPITLAAFRKAIFKRLLPLGILQESTLPPLIYPAKLLIAKQVHIHVFRGVFVDSFVFLFINRKLFSYLFCIRIGQKTSG